MGTSLLGNSLFNEGYHQLQIKLSRERDFCPGISKIILTFFLQAGKVNAFESIVGVMKP